MGIDRTLLIGTWIAEVDGCCVTMVLTEDGECHMTNQRRQLV